MTAHPKALSRAVYRDEIQIRFRSLSLDLIGEYSAETRELLQVWFDGNRFDPAFFRTWLEALDPQAAGSFDCNMDPARVDGLAPVMQDSRHVA